MADKRPRSKPPIGDRHAPVMLEEVLQYLAPADGDDIVDGTFGGGGYTRAILAAADCTVYAMDRDLVAIVPAENTAAEEPGCGRQQGRVR
mgnify:CR=1 FL=1